MMSKPELDESAADGVPSVPITAAFVKAMLRRENQLRWTDEFQRDLALWDGVEKPDPVTKMQEKVASEFGLPSDTGLSIIRSATSLFPDDPEIDECSMYRKYNHVSRGILSIGDDVGEYSLINPDGVLQKLKDIFGEAGGNASTVNVIACGSFT
eukprot:m.19092 g.19092  ORF g.19092 m.19092 type:complete len:154 (-) comp7975_c0_seq3:858-1319(-)